MPEIKYEIINPSALSGTSPKSDIETLNHYQAFTCRIWGRQEGAGSRD